LTPPEGIHTFIARFTLLGGRFCAFSQNRRTAEKTRYFMVEKVTDASFDKDVLKASGPVVVDFWAEWCGPCRMIGPALEEISNSLNGKVKIVKLNVDENPGTAAKYGIMSIPTLMLFKDGQLASRQIGAQPKQKLEQWIAGSI
jgi:thioredoxin 1